MLPLYASVECDRECKIFFGMNPQLKGHYRQKKNGNAKVKELT